MLDRKVGIREFDRSALAELLQGVGPDRITTLGGGLDQTAHGTLASAIWPLDQWGNHAFLPSLLVGSGNIISDLLAWSTAFLQGSGPLSAIMRLMTTAELRGWLEARPPIESRVETLAPLLAICIGESLARRGAAASEQNLSVQGVSNTLSYSLFRARFVAPQLEHDEIVRRWKAVQGGQVEQWHDRITELVIELTDEAARRFFPYGRWHGDARYRSHFDFVESDLAMSSLRHSLPASTRRIVPDALWDEQERLGAEQLIDILDEMGPALERAPDGAPSVRAKVLASVISRTNPEIGNQLELARPMLENLPEIGIWLATRLAQQAPGKLLSANEGVGWKLAARLTGLFDPLSLPLADVAWQELQLASGGSVLIGQKRDDFRAIEIYPGHSVSRPQIAATTQAQSAEKATRSRSLRTRNSPNEVLARAEENLEEVLQTLRNLRRGRI